MVDDASDDASCDEGTGARPGAARKPFTVHPGRREVRSFVLRQGRLTPAQDKAMQAEWPRRGLEFAGAPRDFDAVFGRRAPRVLEIGFGNGEALLWSARRDPARDYIGIEVHAPGVGRLLHGLAAEDVPNARVYCHDAVEVLRADIADAALDEVRIWFPDPWHKKRHHKRRLIQPPFVALLADKIAVGGRLHLATDWQDYAEHMNEAVASEPRFVNRAGPGGWVERPEWRPQTHFETRGLGLGHGIRDLVFDRR
ncbi:tRNA (guanosine(46)-N7)-methyltransferase TrmB [Coralloluteibacterium stylophorae]|uniref:tRNA (guanine-N(7)-)-methyltransferase n=1 Tax=Coralloluteibacterium stylophorae TaxID=1776034 RepID=A0A8J7VUT2_9GAMM|nr:tRNA (guanosine(46)-N7)-methyltransferase TrmB [Coralloluteibacterium stylophorae]MBS7458355.1 tRNA (guanosine(46)-N7)-methyltransferase TrmB [Coralloluteibacterium stylophorae]